MKFKVGDKVKSIEQDGYFEYEEIVTITKIEDDEGLMYRLNDVWWVLPRDIVPVNLTCTCGVSVCQNCREYRTNERVS